MLSGKYTPRIFELRVEQ